MLSYYKKEEHKEYWNKYEDTLLYRALISSLILLFCHCIRKLVIDESQKSRLMVEEFDYNEDYIQNYKDKVKLVL